MRRSFLLLLRRSGLVFLCAACLHSFNPTAYPSSAELYRALLAQFQEGHYANAARGFEQVTLRLATLDSLLPRSYYYLGESQVRNKDYLLATATFAKLYGSFPRDTLADDAMLEAGRAYDKMWPHPELDPKNGEAALDVLSALMSTYPTSSLRETAATEIENLEEKFATKEFLTGMYYYNLKAYESSLENFSTVINQYPTTYKAEEAVLRLAMIYQKLGWKDELTAVCPDVRRLHPNNKDALALCPGAAPAAAP